VSRIDKKSTICVGFVLDISKQKELEARKDEFISTASHELKTPITSLKVLTEFLQQKALKNRQTDSANYLGRMNKQVDKLTELVNTLLDVTQMQAGKLKLKKTMVDLNALIKEVITEVQTITTTHKIVFVARSKIFLNADADRIAQVITNLLTNAIKYSPKDTEILVSAGVKKDDAVISVKDFGQGIDKHYQETIFRQFFRVNENKNATYPGLGMGLFISKQIGAKASGENLG